VISILITSYPQIKKQKNMSHFTVMIIGKDPEEQLKPYDENIVVKPKHVSVVSEKEKKEMIKYYKKNGIEYPTFDELYKEKGMDWNGDSYRKHKNGEWHKYSTYNPNSKWDWYQLGGRWTDFLKLKKGASGMKGDPSLVMDDFRSKEGYADMAYKKDIDFKKMRDDAGKEAGKLYDKAMKILKGLPPIEEWDTIRKRHTKNDTDMSKIDDARKEYNNQPRVKKMKGNHKIFGYFNSPEKFSISREQYVQNARNAAISTFAIIKDGVWYEKGTMGWWGMVSDETDDDEWNKQVSDMLDSVPDDTLISIYDCHI
jgi:hypothetical protein